MTVSEVHQITASHPVGILGKIQSIYWTPAKLQVNNGECSVKFTMFRIQFSDIFTRYSLLEIFGHFFPWNLGWKPHVKDGPVLRSTNRVRPWLLEMRLHHCMYKEDEPVTLDTDWIKNSFMKLYEMNRKMQGLVWDHAGNGSKYNN